MGKLGKKARKFAKKNLQSVLRKKRKFKAMLKRKSAPDHRDNVEKYDALSSEEQFKGKLEHTTIDVAASSNSLDNIYIEDDMDLVEDESESEDILSEDPECPYVSDIELDSNDKDNSECAALSESNKNIHMEIVKQKRKLDRLLEKVPKFSKFLESRRAALQKSKNVETDSDEEPDANYSSGVSVNEDMHLQDRRSTNSYTVDVWCWLVVQQPEGPALPNLLNTFQAACHYGFDSDESHLHEISDKKVFSRVLMFILCEADGIFRKWLGISDSCNKDSFLKLMNKSEWKLAMPLIKSYLRSCLLLLNQVTEGQILVFILCRLRSSIVFFAAFPSLTQLLIKISVHLWVTGEESLSLSSFLVVREIASKLPSDWYDTCLMKTYKAFIGHSRFFEPGNPKQVEFLKKSIVELYSLDLPRSYQQVLASLQQLASILRQTMKTKTKEDLNKIHNWQYIHCISLWVNFIDCNLKDQDLQPLLSLSILIIKGIAHLFPGLRYVPLRFRCVQMLNQLSFSSGVFIPVASLFFDCLDNKGSTADGARVKAFDFSTMLKVPKRLLKSRNFQEECILSAVELISAHFSQWRYHISFPELVTIPLMLFKRFHENLSNETLRRPVKHFIDQVEKNKEYIERRRDEISFSPSDNAAIDSFLQLEKNCSNSNCSFSQYYASLQQKSHSRISLIFSGNAHLLSCTSN
ncbi:nucleolar complex protein 2 homolog isoform X2 [Phalaenopsis equestris]|uniref:nucleolar complex protein 2 homolog isoform X2 n=1 Tax=Phalaenopsis equestris TaxID=78828 RepID=UPI0009E5755D|nr:nucleolar complex protein 2 homolog isoform X2 [Phalaenopsis equestris]